MHVLSWTEINALTHLLAEKARPRDVECIVGISRSGLIPAVMLSHMLGVRAFGVLDIVRTSSDALHAAKSEPVCRGGLNLDIMAGRRVLVVDDIVGEGLTMVAARDELARIGAIATLCTLVVNLENLGARDPVEVADFWACSLHGWVIFPWEGKDGGDA